MTQKKYGYIGCPFAEDFSAGLSDGGDTNPYFTPADRTGESLESYRAGYDEGQECMSEYYESQED